MSLFPLSNIMRRSREKKLLSWEEEPGRRSAAHLLTRTGHLPMQRRAEDCVTVQSIGSIFIRRKGVPMSHAKQASTKRKRSINAVPVLSAAGLSLSLASGASAAIGRPAADMPTSHEITLCEEEISDVSLATFYVFDNEKAGAFRRRIKLAAGGCGGCGGCGDGGGGEGCASSYSGAAPFGSYVTPPRYSKPTRKRRAGA
jgi:hypothetical protein